MSKRFYRKFIHSKTFKEWIKRLKAFDYELIKENNLQNWKPHNFKDYWERYKGAI